MNDAIKCMCFLLLLSPAAYAEVTTTALSCADFNPTPAALERFENLKGACEAVVERNGQLYGLFRAVVRRASSRSVVLYLPVTGNTFTVEPESDARVLIGGKKFRPRELQRGQEIQIYLSVNSFSTPDVEEVLLISETDVLLEHIVFPVTALPTTASLWPFIGLVSLLLTGTGLLMRRYRLKRGE